MINTVIFDIGNVLAYFCWKEVFESIFDESEFEKIAKHTVFDLETWNHIDQGVMEFDDYIELVCKDMQDKKNKVREAIIKTYERIEAFDYAENWVKDLKSRGYKVYILSNYGEFPFSLSKDRFGFLDHVDGKIISYEVKLIKPHKEIFEALFKKYDINPENAVFVDDNANNIVGANAVGLKTVHFKDFESGSKELELILEQ